MPGRGHSPCTFSEVGSGPSKEALGPEGKKRQGGVRWVGSGPKGEGVGVGSEQRGSLSATGKWTSRQGQSRGLIPSSVGGITACSGEGAPRAGGGDVDLELPWPEPSAQFEGKGGRQQEEGELSSFIFEMTLFAGCLKF